MTEQHPRDSCYFCGSDSNMESHHVLPKRFGGPDSDDNLVDVCRACHQKLENLYDDSFWNKIEISKADHPPDYRSFDDDMVTRWNPIVAEGESPEEPEPKACARCDRYGPFNKRSKQPEGQPMFVCCRCDHAMVLGEYTRVASVLELTAALESDGIGVRKREIVRAAEQVLDMSPDEVKKELDRLTNRGDAYEPRQDYYRAIDTGVSSSDGR